MNFETTIGLEVHVELKTKSKIFSPSPVQYGAEPNENTNVIDWGYPGTLPTINRQVIANGITAALALHAEIEKHPHFDRKNYFYPDNPKGYQVTENDRPAATNGWIEVQTDQGPKKIGIAELHVEEDAGKNTHGKRYSYVDLNRQGTPLIEIVSKAEMNSPQEAYDYLEGLRERIQFTGISDVRMEEGSMRVDCNISIHPIGSSTLGQKIELKNLNSFNYVRKALAYEEERQAQVIRSGGTIGAETRRFDELTGKTYLMRVKEGKDDYRYFPEPDLPSLSISDEWISELQEQLPEMPESRRARYVKDFGLTDYDAMVLTQTKEMSDFFDRMMELQADPKMASNYLQGDVNAYLNDQQTVLERTKITPEALASMIKMISDQTISTKMAKKVFKAITNGEDPAVYVKEHGLVQLSDPDQLQPIIDQVLADNPQSIVDFHNGKDRAVGFLVGQIMKQTHGKANPQIVNKLLMQALNK
ncbi:Aspartyl-tRNA(Asn) amidotransferase subunit B [Fructilactobacillus florum 8D]|uniref:Aspartyl/glutamyl-tRNA(Asn/Gln) amidotransferase subunit B n=2 Tax=Fructilactobacillus florum TaxID=640331 RepID=W9EJ18_9LACO|nr:Asp-tRNA(Asn)/Glu-tRNA(Gln) amidotransferase subunit GatB [Fructilactobacillus florum]ETO40965.1 Aspartyl-tRNA(Asn) amidotransferase subunit B [Fructilactobacillus florum 8D]KRM91190.1 aspartyl glutamyl-tRNA amidotransferase subunit B [Fructilactobacillus florum DSM 22689 = JCM 16035]